MGTLDFAVGPTSETVKSNNAPQETVLETVDFDKPSKKKYTLNDLKALAPNFQQVCQIFFTSFYLPLYQTTVTTATTESWKCYCKLKTAKKRSKKANENFNREFHCCSKNKCRFFRWEPSVSTVSLSTTPTKRQHAKLQDSSGPSISLTDSPLTKKRFFPPPRIETTSISLPRTDSKSTSIMSSSMSESRFEKFDQMLHDPDSLLLRCSYFA